MSVNSALKATNIIGQRKAFQANQFQKGKQVRRYLSHQDQSSKKNFQQTVLLYQMQKATHLITLSFANNEGSRNASQASTGQIFDQASQYIHQLSVDLSSLFSCFNWAYSNKADQPPQGIDIQEKGEGPRRSNYYKNPKDEKFLIIVDFQQF